LAVHTDEFFPSTILLERFGFDERDGAGVLGARLDERRAAMAMLRGRATYRETKTRFARRERPRSTRSGSRTRARFRSGRRFVDSERSGKNARACSSRARREPRVGGVMLASDVSVRGRASAVQGN